MFKDYLIFEGEVQGQTSWPGSGSTEILRWSSVSPNHLHHYSVKYIFHTKVRNRVG